MSDGRRVLVLGGGVGGVVTAVELRKKLPDHHDVILVDKQPDHVFAPSLLWLLVGDRTASSISRPLARLSKRGIEVVTGEVENIDPEAREVTVDGQVIEADFLVISLGAELAPDAIPGLAEAGHNFYELPGAESLSDALAAFAGGKVVVLTAAPAYKCPAAPYEAAMLIADHCRKRGIGEATEIDLYAAEPGPLGVAGPEVSAGVRQMVEERGIGYHPEHQVVSAHEDHLEFIGGAKASFDLLAYVPPHRAPQVVRAAGLVDDSGWVPVDRNKMETRFPNVYAIGDITGIPLASGKALPMAGVFAHGQAEVVAQNIAWSITGKGKLTEFKGSGECFIETGEGKAGFGRGNFYAEPDPRIKLHKVAKRYHAGKVVFEKNWLRKWF